jgi:hypothetical protein
MTFVSEKQIGYHITVMEKSSSNKKSQIHYAIFFHILKWNSFIGLTKMMKTKEVTNSKEKHQVTIGWANMIIRYAKTTTQLQRCLQIFIFAGYLSQGRNE